MNTDNHQAIYIPELNQLQSRHNCFNCFNWILLLLYFYRRLIEESRHSGNIYPKTSLTKRTKQNTRVH